MLPEHELEHDKNTRPIVEKVWGYEEVIVNNDKYCGKLLVVIPDHHSSLHYHNIKDETFLALSGNLVVEVHFAKDKEPYFTILRGWARDSIHIPPKTPHRFWTLEDSPVLFVEFSTPHSDDDVERIEPSD